MMKREEEPYKSDHRFAPSKRGAIERYLMRRAMNQLLPNGYAPHDPDPYNIIERTVYGDQSPWDVFTEDDPWEFSDDHPDQKVIYCFSKVVSKSVQSKNRLVRTAGCGTWDGKAVSAKILDAHGKIIGHKRAFTFKPKRGSDSQGKGKWILHEYSLAEPDKFLHPEYVFCKITNHFSPSSGTTPATAATEADDDAEDDYNGDEQENDDSGSTNENLSRKRKRIQVPGSTQVGRSGGGGGLLDQEKNQEPTILAAAPQGGGEVASGIRTGPSAAFRHPDEVVLPSCELSLAFPPSGLQLTTPQQQQPPRESVPVNRPRVDVSREPVSYSTLQNASENQLLIPYASALPFPPGWQLQPHQYLRMYRPWMNVNVWQEPVSYYDLLKNASENQEVIPYSQEQASSPSGTHAITTGMRRQDEALTDKADQDDQPEAENDAITTGMSQVEAPVDDANQNPPQAGKNVPTDD